MVVDINRYTGFAGNALRYRDCLRPLSLFLLRAHKERWNTQPPTILSRGAFRPLRENYRYTRRTRESFCHGDASHAADYRVNIYRGNPLTRIGSYRRL